MSSMAAICNKHGSACHVTRTETRTEQETGLRGGGGGGGG